MKRNTNPRPGATFSLGALAIATALAFAGQPAVAAVVTTLPDAVAQPFSLHSRPVTGPQAFGDGGTYLATNLEGVPTSSFFGYTGSFTFPSGDNWGGGEPFAALGLQTAIMNFSFKDPVAGALAEFIGRALRTRPSRSGPTMRLAGCLNDYRSTPTTRPTARASSASNGRPTTSAASRSRATTSVSVTSPPSRPPPPAPCQNPRPGR